MTLILGRVDLPRPSMLRSGLNLLNPLVSSRAACRDFLRSIPLRKWNGTALVRMPQSGVHSLIVAPPGSGKTQGLVLNFLKTCPDPCFVLDIKPEIVSAVARHREKAFGHRVVILDPDHVVTDHPDTLNHLESIRPGSVIEDIYSLASEIVVRSGHEDGDATHFLESAELFIAAAAACSFVHGDSGRPSLQLVREALCNPHKLEAAKTLLCGSGGLLARLGHQLGFYVEREFGGAVTTSNRFLRWLDTPSMAASTAASSFNPEDLPRTPMTVFIVCQHEHLKSRAGWLRATVGTLTRAVIRGGVQRTRLVHGVIDEAAAVLPLPSIDAALAAGRGFGLRLQLYLQAVSQLKKCFPNGQDATVLATTSQVFFSVNDLETATYVSNRCGDETILVNSGGTNAGRSYSLSDGFGPGSRSWSHGSNDGWQQQPRKLLTPDEVCGLDPRTALSFFPGVGAPVVTRIVMAFEEPSLGTRPGFFRRTVGALKTLLASVALLLVTAAILAALLARPSDRTVRPEADGSQFFPKKGR